jgi:hypothetical protein
MIGLVAASVYYGQPKRLTHAYDYKGKLCGVDVPEEFVFFCGSKQKVPPQYGNFPAKLDFQARTCVASCPNASSIEKIPCMRPPSVVFNELKPVVENGVNYQKTYELDVQQSVQLGEPYATQQLGRYCVPTEANLELRNSLLFGPLRRENAFGKVAASFMHAWPVLLGVSVLAVLLGMAYLHVLKKYAGVLIFFSMAFATVILFAVGVFFFLALFIWDVEDLNSGYNKLNPLVHTMMGNDARFLSVFLGLILMMMSVCMGFTTKTAMPEIDKSIGAIKASLDCIFSGGCASGCCSPLMLEALTKAFLIVVQLVVCMIGLALVTSVGYLENDSLIINGEAVKGMDAGFRWYWGWSMAIAFYIFMTWWLFEFQVARYQFTVTYAVCMWYYEKPVTVPGQSVTMNTSSGPKQVDINVGGVDSAPGQRKGVRVKTGSQEVVVAAVGGRGPRYADVISMMPESVTYKGKPGEKKDMPSGAVCGGSDKSIIYHLGSLAQGCIIVAITRPFRLFATAVRALIGKSADRKFTEETDPSFVASFRAMLSLVVNIIESTFIGVSKNAYCAMVLGSTDFWPSAKDAKLMLEDAGGSVAFLHGSTGLYEIIAIVSISAICSVAAMISFTYISCFTDHNNSTWFVEDTESMTIAAAAISAIIAYGFMSLFNVTLDALLYVFSWSRKMKIAKNKEVCPLALRSMINPNEWDADPDSSGALAHIQPRSQTMAATHVWHSLHASASNAYNSYRGTSTERNPLLSTAPGMQP